MGTDHIFVITTLVKRMQIDPRLPLFIVQGARILHQVIPHTKKTLPEEQRTQAIEFETWIILGVKTNTNSSFSTFSLPPLLGDHLSHLNVIHLVHRHHLYNGQTTYIVAKNITENSSNIPSCNSCTMLQTFLAHLPFNLLLRAPSPSNGSHPLPIVQFV